MARPRDDEDEEVPKYIPPPTKPYRLKKGMSHVGASDNGIAYLTDDQFAAFKDKFEDPNAAVDRAAAALPVGPTLEEWEGAGYKASGYPPVGFAPRWTPYYQQYIDSKVPGATRAQAPALGPTGASNMGQDDTNNPTSASGAATDTPAQREKEAAGDPNAGAQDESAKEPKPTAEKPKPAPVDPRTRTR